MESAGIGMENPAYVQKRLVLGKQQGALNQFCKETGLTRQRAREKAYGVASQPRALKVLTREKARLVKGTHPVTQEQIDGLVNGKLSGVRLSAHPTYNPRISSYGKTKIKYDENGNRQTIMEIGKQKRPGEAELVDSIIHEELEARIALNPRASDRYFHLNSASNDERHAYIQKIIDRHVKTKGIK